MLASNSPPSRTCMLARTTCSFTLAVPTNLIVIEAALKTGFCGAAAPLPGGAAGACAWTEVTPAATSSRTATNREVTLRIGLLMVVFKAGDVSKEGKLQFSYRAVSLLGND